MNTMYAAKITRPEGMSEEEPLAIPLHNPLPLHMRVKWVTGGPYKNLASAKKWVTIKSALSALDAAAEVHLVSGEAGDPFTIISATRGLLDILIPTTEMDNLTVGTVYYVDVQILEDTQPYTILYDRIRPFQSVTKATA